MATEFKWQGSSLQDHSFFFLMLAANLHTTHKNAAP